MTGAQFLNAVALGQVTPGPVVQTVAVVGYAAGGLGSALIASLVAFTPSFVFVLLGAPHLNRLRANATVRAFLAGAAPAAIGAIAGSAISLGLELQRMWQVVVLGAAVIWLVVARRGVVSGLLAWERWASSWCRQGCPPETPPQHQHRCSGDGTGHRQHHR
jgi:chromate transporter